MNKMLVRNALKDAATAHRAFVRWHLWCKGLTDTMTAAGLYAAEDYNTEAWRQRCIAIEREYEATHKKPSMPSKNRKHRMYSDIHRAVALAELDVPAGSIKNLDDIARVMNEVTAALAAA